MAAKLLAKDEGGKTTVESCQSIDVLHWNWLGYFRYSPWFSWVRTRDGERLASLEIRHHSVILKYRSRSHGEDWSIEDVTIDSKGRLIPRLYSKLQASRELRAMLNIGRPERESDVWLIRRRSWESRST